MKLDDGCDQDETDNPKNAKEVLEDIEEVIDMWNEKRRIDLSNVAKEKYRVCVMWLIVG